MSIQSCFRSGADILADNSRLLPSTATDRVAVGRLEADRINRNGDLGTLCGGSRRQPRSPVSGAGAAVPGEGRSRERTL